MAKALPSTIPNLSMTKDEFYALCSQIENFAASENDEIDFLLIGKTGNGKSSTGNSILRTKAFVSKPSLSAVTNEIQVANGSFKYFKLKVVDGPGLGNTSDTPENPEDKKEFMRKMRDAVTLNSRGYHAFLLIIKYNNRLTDEDKECVRMLKEIFGPDFMRQYGIIVMTGGDQFECDFPDQEKAFEEWCLEQEHTNGLFKHIFNECGKRVVLFNNRTKSQNKLKIQLKNLIQLLNQLPNGDERFSESYFRQTREMLENPNNNNVLAGQKILENVYLMRQMKEWVGMQQNDNQLYYLKRLQGSVDIFYKNLREKAHQSRIIKDMKKLVKSFLNNITKDIDDIENLVKSTGIPTAAHEELKTIEAKLYQLHQDLQHVDRQLKKFRNPKKNILQKAKKNPIDQSDVTNLEERKRDIKRRIGEENRKYEKISKSITAPERQENKIIQKVLIEYDRKLKEILKTSTANDEKFVSLYEEKKNELHEKLKSIGSSDDRCKIM